MNKPWRIYETFQEMKLNSKNISRTIQSRIYKWCILLYTYVPSCHTRDRRHKNLRRQNEDSQYHEQQKLDCSRMYRCILRHSKKNINIRENVKFKIFFIAELEELGINTNRRISTDIIDNVINDGRNHGPLKLYQDSIS